MPWQDVFNLPLDRYHQSLTGASSAPPPSSSYSKPSPAHIAQPVSRQSSLAPSYLYGRNFLVIEKVSPDDTGIISCVANNSNSIVRHEMLLFVKGRGSLETMHLLAHSATFGVGFQIR